MGGRKVTGLGECMCAHYLMARLHIEFRNTALTEDWLQQDYGRGRCPLPNCHDCIA